MNSLLKKLSLEKLPVFYADARIEDSFSTQIVNRNGEIVSFAQTPSVGAFLRVFDRGKWFYTSTTDLGSLDQAFQELVAQAKSVKEMPIPQSWLKRFGRRQSTTQGEQKFQFSNRSVREVPVSARMDLINSYLRHFKGDAEIVETQGRYGDLHKIKYFQSSRGVSFAHDFQYCSVFMSWTLRKENRIFQDVWMKNGPTFADLVGRDAEVSAAIQESKPFLDAPVIEPGHYRTLLESKVVGIFAHESFGHKSEADFMMGDDHALAEWKIGKKVGADCLSIVDSGLPEDTSGYCPWDDEGTPASKTYLIKNGILQSRLHSQQTSMEIDEEPTGNGRAMDFEFEPIVRMTCTYVEAGKESFEEVLSRIDDGIYIKDSRGGSGMSTFTISPIKAYRIRKGKIAEPVRISVISGSVFEALEDVEACTREFELASGILGGCGKGEQWPLPVSSGGPKVLIRKLFAS